MTERKLKIARKTILVMMSAVMIFFLPVTSFAMPSGLRKENRHKLEKYLEALWLGEWNSEETGKIVITADTLTPERLNEYVTPLADHYGWGRKLGEAPGKVWKEEDLKNVLIESIGVTDEMADQAFFYRRKNSIWARKDLDDNRVADDEWFIVYGDWGLEWPETHIELIADLGNGLYKVDGRVEFIDSTGYFAPIIYPFTSIFRENNASRFGELTLVQMEIN